MRTRLAVMLGAAVMCSAAQAQPSATDPTEWPRYAHDLGGTRYSPLRQIDAGNVSRLAVAWSYRVRPDGGGAIVSSATPIVVDDVMYLPVGNAVVAIEPETGREIWRHPVTDGVVRRAVSYWPGDATHPPRIFYSTGNHLVALSAKTGEIDPTFGTDGQNTFDPPYNYPPTIYKNVLIVGASVAELPVGPAGDTRAFDAVTGKPLWVFHTVPRPGEPGHETWLDNGWKGRSGTNVWVWYMTLDAKTDTLYMPVGGPSPNYYGGDRPGANLFGNSVVAVDAETGKLKWYFQTIHHDLWDSDLPAPPVLVDIRKDGKTIPALAETGKAAFMYILNRDTGQPVFGVKEMPVAHGDVPGEWYSPTQPIPVKPPRLIREHWTPADIVTPEDTSPEHSAACHALLQKYGGFFNSDPFTPFFLHEDGGPMKASLKMPMNGGSNWGGSAVDPTTGYVYVNISEGAAIGFIEKRKPGLDYGRGTQGSWQLYDRASLSGPGAYTSFSAPYTDPATGRTTSLPCIRPPWGRLIAVDANTGDIAWAVPLGVTDGLPPGKQDTGRYNELGGPIVTAGGVIFIGGTDDHRFRAFDEKTGKELWETRLDYNAQDVPITYRGKDGRQYVAVVAAGGAGPRGPDGKPANAQALVAFALPQ